MQGFTIKNYLIHNPQQIEIIFIFTIRIGAARRPPREKNHRKSVYEIRLISKR